MEYKYLSYVIDAWNSNPYFDPREVQGCSDEEINELKRLLAPYMRRMPKAIEEDLRFHGRYSLMGKGTYLVNKYEAIEEDGIDLVAALEMGFWATSIAGMGVLCDDKKLLTYLVGKNNYELVGYDDPPVIWKTGDLEDNDLEITVSRNRYSGLYQPLIKQFLPSYTFWFENRPELYVLKQRFLDFIVEMENCHVVMEGMPQKKLQRIIHHFRLQLGKIGVHGKLSKMEVYNKLVRKDMDEILLQLRAFSNKIDFLYNDFNKAWEDWDKSWKSLYKR